jgi:hypothetical protein
MTMHSGGGNGGGATGCGRGSTAGWWAVVVDDEVAQAGLQQAAELAVVTVAVEVVDEAAVLVEVTALEASLQLVG